MELKIGNFVKWSVGEGFGFGKVFDVSDETSAKVLLPSGQSIDIDKASLEVVEKDVYIVAVKNLINQIITETGEGLMTLEEAQAKIAELEKSAQEKEAALSQEIANVKTENESLKTKIEESQSQYNALDLKLKEIEKATVIANRIADLGEAFIKETFKVENVSEASDKLFALTEDHYSLFKNMAESFTKLTQVTQTNLPKSTEQTITTEPKLTEQTQSSEEVEDPASASLEQDLDLSTIASDESTNILREAMAELIKSK